jgi:hypothetical protein
MHKIVAAALIVAFLVLIQAALAEEKYGWASVTAKLGLAK